MTRIKSDTVELDYENTLAFFERRAANAQPEDYLAVTVFRNREEAERRHAAECAQILPFLNLNQNSRVLEIGCGAGRWANTLLNEILSPASNYVGIDFSPSLIQLARQVNGNPKAEFHVMRADALDERVLGAKAPYTHAIVSALLLYLNDSAVEHLFRGLERLVGSGGILYVREPICIERHRLTLVDEYSSALGDSYNAIYRTDDEMRYLLTSSGAFSIIDSSDLEGSLFSTQSETRHRYYLARHR